MQVKRLGKMYIWQYYNHNKLIYIKLYIYVVFLKEIVYLKLKLCMLKSMKFQNIKLTNKLRYSA